ncbi:MAG: hypothetical protein ACK4NZ_04730 [Tsuneonella sp.]
MARLDTATAAKAEWIAHRYDLPRDAFVLRWFERERHAGVPFLTDEYLGPAAGEPDWIQRQQVVAIEQAPVHFVLHSAFCNSTLLVRALDRPGSAMGLSEPVVLNDLVGMRRRGEADVSGFAERLDAALALLSRPWGEGEAVVIKPSNMINPVSAGLLALRPDAKAVVMHTDLPAFLGSVARKGLVSRLWVRELAQGYLRDGAFAPLGLQPEDFLRLTDLQVAAAGWLAQQFIFGQLAARHGMARIAGLSAERLSASPVEALARVRAHFGVSDPGDGSDGSETLYRHSKTGAPFDMAARKADQDRAAALHGDEIAAVVEWASLCAERAGVGMDLPFPL